MRRLSSEAGSEADGNGADGAGGADGAAKNPLAPPPAPPASGVARLTSRRLISVAGPEAAKYLQGRTTSNIISGFADRHGFYSGFLNAQGRVLNDVFVYRDTLRAPSSVSNDDHAAFLVEVDADEAATLERQIRRSKLRAKFDVRLLDVDELAVWHAWGAGSDAEARTGQDPRQELIQMFDSRAPGLGWRYIVPSSSSVQPAPPAALAVDVVDESAYRIHRYLLGVAEGQRELLPGQALPLESNMDLMGGIDFHKGCYVGQELTIRTRHRGVVRKRILPCEVFPMGPGMAGIIASLTSPAALAYRPDPRPGQGACLDLAGSVPPETSIGRAGRKGRSAGKWLAGVGNIGLALCRLETMTDIVLPEEAAAAAATPTATPTPNTHYIPGEFVMKWKGVDGTDEEETAVLVRAHVPDWLRQGLVPDTA